MAFAADLYKMGTLIILIGMNIVINQSVIGLKLIALLQFEIINKVPLLARYLVPFFKARSFMFI